MTADKRKHIRIHSENLSHVIIYEDDIAVNESIGKTLNISESGICLETTFPLEPKNIVVMTIAVEENLLNIDGEVVYSRSDGHSYRTGIRFHGIDPAEHQILQDFIRMFTAHRYASE